MGDTHLDGGGLVQDGTVVLNTVLGDDTSATDNIVVSGNTSGNTQVKMNNAGGQGAQTVDGIRSVEVQGQSDGTFIQSGRIVAGAYDYSLMKNGKDWYLTSQYAVPAETPTSAPDAQPSEPAATDPVAASDPVHRPRVEPRWSVRKRQLYRQPGCGQHHVRHPSARPSRGNPVHRHSDR